MKTPSSTNHYTSRPILIIALLAALTSTVLADIKTTEKLPSGFPRLGLVAFWPAGGNARDIIGGHNGTLLNGSGYTTGIDGSAFNLDNTTGIYGGWGSSIFPAPAFDGGKYVSVPNSPTWNFGSKDFTIQLWAKFNDVPVYDIGHSQGGILVSHDDGAFDVNKWWFALGGGVLNMHLNDPMLGPQWLVQAPFTPNINQWYHLALTRKGNLFTIYVNGIAIGSELSTRALPVATAPLNIGEAEGFYFNGQLDSIAIFKRALSANELKHIFRQHE
jgi:Concanavalin A-like lectin/glucanases superfamily